MHGSRWMPPRVAAAVHGSTTPELAVAESLARHRRANVPEWQAMPLLLCGFRAELSAVIDLTDAEVRRATELPLESLLGENWTAANRAGRESLGQALGRAAYRRKIIEGLIVPSATGESGANLVVFPARLRVESRLQVLHGDDLI